MNGAFDAAKRNARAVIFIDSADVLKDVFEDGKLLYAHDQECGRDLQQAQTYFVRAVETVCSNRRSDFRNKAGGTAGNGGNWIPGEVTGRN